MRAIPYLSQTHSLLSSQRARFRPSRRSEVPPYFIEDAAAAVAWVFHHIADYGGAGSRIFVSGHSAGAYLTLMLGLDKRWLFHVRQDTPSMLVVTGDRKKEIFPVDLSKISSSRTNR